MISLAKVLLGQPIPITQSIYFYQPTIREIVEMGEDDYWILLNLWTLKRKDILQQETEESKAMDDFDVWKMYIFNRQEARDLLIKSCDVFLKSKVEFFDITGTIYIGEKENGSFLDETFYLWMRELCARISPDSGASDEGKQYRETDHMSEREKQLIAKMKSGEQKLAEARQSNVKPEDYLGNRITGLVAVGGYTYEQVYNMTMLQLDRLLKKYIDIQLFELKTVLSPYISSDEGQNENKFWLE